MDSPTANLEHIGGKTRRVMNRLVTIFQNRIELLMVEIQEAREKMIRVVLLALGAAVFGLLAGVAPQRDGDPVWIDGLLLKRACSHLAAVEGGAIYRCHVNEGNSDNETFHPHQAARRRRGEHPPDDHARRPHGICDIQYQRAY